MLSFMRTHATGWFIKILLGTIVVVFVFWGAGSSRSKKANSVAKVNGSLITIEEYQEVYNKLLEDIRHRFGKEIDKNMLKLLNVEKQALIYMVDRKIISDEAERLTIKVTDEELADYIKNNERFQNDEGVFDHEIYNRVLRTIRTTPEKFEAGLRKDIQIQKLVTFVVANAKVEENEARKWYNWQNSSINIKYLLFDPLLYKNIPVSENEIKDYFETHSKDYETREKLKVEYCRFEFSDYEKKVELSNDEIEDNYEANIEQYKNPKKVEARHILLKLNKDADEETIEKRKEDAYEIIRIAESGKDFAGLASEFSECPTASSGGYLGSFTKETMVAPFGEAAFSLKEGQISEPVRTVYGWHIIKVEKIHNESITPVSKAKEDIAEKLKSEKAKFLAFDEADRFRESIADTGDWAAAAEEKNIKIIKTDFFTADSVPDDIQNKEEFAGAAFALQNGEISDIIGAEDEYLIIRTTDRILPQIPAFDTVKNIVREDLEMIIQKDKAKKDAYEALKALKEGSVIEEIAKKYGLDTDITGFFKKNEPIEDIGYDSIISKAVFNLNSEKPNSVVAGEKGWYLFTLVEKKFPENQEFEKHKEKTIKEIKNIKREKLYFQWLSDLRNKSEIEDLQGILER